MTRVLQEREISISNCAKVKILKCPEYTSKNLHRGSSHGITVTESSSKVPEASDLISESWVLAYVAN